MRFHAFPCVSMRFHAFSRVSMRFHAFSRVSMRKWLRKYVTSEHDVLCQDCESSAQVWQQVSFIHQWRFFTRKSRFFTRTWRFFPWKMMKNDEKWWFAVRGRHRHGVMWLYVRNDHNPRRVIDLCVGLSGQCARAMRYMRYMRSREKNSAKMNTLLRQWPGHDCDVTVFTPFYAVLCSFLLFLHCFWLVYDCFMLSFYCHLKASARIAAHLLTNEFIVLNAKSTLFKHKIQNSKIHETAPVPQLRQLCVRWIIAVSIRQTSLNGNGNPIETQ